MVVTICGAGGLIGQFLTREFRKKGWTLKTVHQADFAMDDSTFLKEKIEGSEVVINLAGASIASKWTPARKQEIYDSRIQTTRKITRSVISAQTPPEVYISSSAIGIYDNVHTHDEESINFDTGFLGKVCLDWEAEAQQASGVTRVVSLRTGVVLSADGGALEKMHFPFSIGLGGKIGKGTQPFSFIHIDDLVNIFLFVITNGTISGPVNAVSPYPSTNLELTEKFGKVFKQPAFLTIPNFVLRMKLGEGAVMLLEGQKVLPSKLESAGFKWKYPTIQNALVNLYG